MTRADFNSHPATDRRTFDFLPVQICGAYEGTRNEDGTGMDLYPDLCTARDTYPDLPDPEGTNPEGTKCERFFGPEAHVIEGQLVIRYETLAARLRFAGHKFTMIDDYMDVFRAKGDAELIDLVPR
jgi:hypothetical protein